ncbi:hypothetical protein TNCV_2218941 [Trichonephila clavipes]|nr:hypothetical protein TNCV_2218941 [Trichonephila clavipes]
MSLRIGDLTVLNVLIWKAFVQSYIEKTVSSLIFAHQCIPGLDGKQSTTRCLKPPNMLTRETIENPLCITTVNRMSCDTCMQDVIFETFSRTKTVLQERWNCTVGLQSLEMQDRTLKYAEQIP